MQFALHLDVLGQRLARLAGAVQCIRLLHQAVNDDVLVVGPLLRARLRQQRGQYQNQQGNKTFHAGMLIQQKPAWQMITAELASAGGKKAAC